MENEEDPQQMLEIITKTAEHLEIEVQDMAPFLEMGFVGKMSERTQGLSVEDEDLISIAVEVIGEMALADDEQTTEPETETPVVEAEVEDVETTTEDETTDDEAIATAILSFLNQVEKGATVRSISLDTGFSKEQVDSVVKAALVKGLAHKVNKTVFYGPDPETVDELITVEVEDAEPTADKTNNAFEHALTMQFDGIRELFITELNKVQSTAEADSGFKSQAEQYTEVMSQLRAVFDRLQEGQEQFHLHNPVIKEFARIAEWHPEA